MFFSKITLDAIFTCCHELNDIHIRTLPWPALSPDLNPIEHLWDELGRLVRRRANPLESIDQLQRELTNEWNNIHQAFVMRLIGSMRVGV